MPREAFVIIGASLAGAGAAATLRKQGFEGRIVLIGEEHERPYERPSLSKDFLRGESGRDAVYVHGPNYYADKDIDLRTGVRVTAFEPATRHVVLDGGERLRYDRLLLATGSSPRRLRVPGADLAGVHYLRTIADSESIREAAKKAGQTLVIGGGWIGAEVAASIRQLGRSVGMVAPSSVPLERVLGPEVGRVYRDLHLEHGVELHMNQRLASFVGERAVEAIRTEDGTTIEADLVVVGTGAEPRVEMAKAAGLEVDDGVWVDEFLESSVPGVFAAGDIAGAWHRVLGRRIRVEHWDNAKRQGPAAARNMLGEKVEYRRVPYFYSDQFDFDMEYTGHALTWDRIVFRGDPESRAFVAFWLADGFVQAGMWAGVGHLTEAIGRLVASGRRVYLKRLADPSIPLEEHEHLLRPAHHFEPHL